MGYSRGTKKPISIRETAPIKHCSSVASSQWSHWTHSGIRMKAYYLICSKRETISKAHDCWLLEGHSNPMMWLFVNRKAFTTVHFSQGFPAMESTDIPFPIQLTEFPDDRWANQEELCGVSMIAFRWKEKQETERMKRKPIHKWYGNRMGHTKAGRYHLKFTWNLSGDVCCQWEFGWQEEDANRKSFSFDLQNEFMNFRLDQMCRFESWMVSVWVSLKCCGCSRTLFTLPWNSINPTEPSIQSNSSSDYCREITTTMLTHPTHAGQFNGILLYFIDFWLILSHRYC